LQHGTASQTFKARVAVGSWGDTPLLPADLPAEIIGKYVKAKSSPKEDSPKGKGKAKVVHLVDTDVEMDSD
jgi:hypothetical protein